MMEKIKTIQEYQQLAARTCPDLGNEAEANIRHMHLGVITEVGEVLDVLKKKLAYGKEMDTVNIGEELADIAWYKANEARMFSPKLWSQEEFEHWDKDLDKFLLAEEEGIINSVTVEAYLVALLPDIYSDTQEAVYNIRDMVLIKKIAVFYGLDFWQILTNNITKLKVRYPEKFTEENALNRDLDSERKELEK